MSDLEQVAAGIQPERSAADFAREAYEDAVAQDAVKDERLPLLEPKFELHLTFAPLRDYRDFRRQTKRAAKGKADDAAREIALAMTALRMASTGGYILADGERFHIAETLGLPMHQALFPIGRPIREGVAVRPQNHGEAIADLFWKVGDLGIIGMYAKLDAWITAGCPPETGDDDEDAGDEAMESALGESSAG